MLTPITLELLGFNIEIILSRIVRVLKLVYNKGKDNIKATLLLLLILDYSLEASFLIPFFIDNLSLSFPSILARLSITILYYYLLLLFYLFLFYILSFFL